MVSVSEEEFEGLATQGPTPRSAGRLSICNSNIFTHQKYSRDNYRYVRISMQAKKQTRSYVIMALAMVVMLYEVTSCREIN